MIKIKRGLDLPVSGEPEQSISDAPRVRAVALVGYDYNGMKPTMLVKEGDHVRTGQPVFSDKKNSGVQFTAPATGVVAQINRGAKRVFESLVIDVEDDQPIEFARYSESELPGLSREQVAENLQQSGLWTALRTRPFSKIPVPGTAPAAIFVNCMDSNPLAANPALVIAEQEAAFLAGVRLLGKLTDGKVYVTAAPAESGKESGKSVPSLSIDNVQTEQFSGPHPAGLVGTHIHFLAPASAQRQVWTLGYQDAIAVGKLFLTGTLYTDRIVALAGPLVEKPRLLKTRLGANLDELCAGQLSSGEPRVVSGSLLAGRQAAATTAYLGRYHDQVCVLHEGREREFLGWISPGLNKHSVMPIYLSSVFGRNKKRAMTTTTNGSERAMVPIGAYENIMPLDILPTQLLRALIVGDTATAQELGALELDEEDLGLCSYVCPGKYEYGAILRDNLNRIEKEG